MCFIVQKKYFFVHSLVRGICVRVRCVETSRKQEHEARTEFE